MESTSHHRNSKNNSTGRSFDGKDDLRAILSIFFLIFHRNEENEEDQKTPEIVDIVVDYSASVDHTHIVAIIAVVSIAILAFAVYIGLIYWRYHLQ